MSSLESLTPARPALGVTAMVMTPAGSSYGAAGAHPRGSAQLRRDRRRRAEARMRGLLVRDGVRLASHRGGPSSLPVVSSAARPAGDFRALLAQLRGLPGADASVGTVDALRRRLDTLEGTLQHSVEMHGQADGRFHDALAAERDARGAHLSSLVACLTSLEQRLTHVESTLQDSVDKLSIADALHSELTSALEALQAQFATHDVAGLRAALAGEKDAREALQNSLVDHRALLEQRLTRIEESQEPADQNANAREADACLPPPLYPDTVQQRLEALETKLGDELSHPDTVLQRLVILEMKVSDERPLDVSAHAADDSLPPALYPGAVRQRIDELETKLDAHSPPIPSPGAVQQRLDALEAKVNDELMKVAYAPRPGELRGDQSCSYALGQRMLWSLCAEKAAREAHQNSMRVGHAALEQRLDVVAQALHDSAGEHSSTLETGLASMAHELRVEIHRAANWRPPDLAAARANPDLWGPAVELEHEPRVSAPSSPPRS